MKRTLASLIPIGLVFSATAYAAAPMLPEEVPVIDEKDRFVIGAELHIFRPSQTDLGYVFTVDADGNEKQHYLDPDFDCGGGRLFASYMFTNENDIQISWTHSSERDNDRTFVADATSFGISPVFSGFEGSLVGLESVKLTKDVDIDIVDVDMGRVFHDENYMVRIFAGLRYAMIDDELKMTVFDGTDFQFTKGDSQMDGVGPRGGFDARYRLMDHVSLTGHAAIALIKGYIDAKTTYPTVPVTHTKTDEIQRMVPNLDARLGVAVDFLFDNGWGLVVEGGFHADHFFNGSTIASPSGVAVTRDVSNYGPYLGAALMFS